MSATHSTLGAVGRNWAPDEIVGDTHAGHADRGPPATLDNQPRYGLGMNTILPEAPDSTSAQVSTKAGEVQTEAFPHAVVRRHYDVTGRPHSHHDAMPCTHSSEISVATTIALREGGEP